MVMLLKYLDRSKFLLSLAVVNKREAVYLKDLPKDVEFIDLGCSRVRQSLPKVIRIIWKLRPDVVFSTLGHLNLALAIVRPLLPNDVLYVARECAVVSLMPSAYSIPFWWFWAYRYFYKRFALVICQSNDMRDDLLQQFGFPAEKAVVINNPCDEDYVRRMAGEVVKTGMVKKGANGASIINLLAAGRLTKQKGFDLLIEAIAICGDPRLRLTLLGEGPVRAELQRLTEEKGLTDQVRIVGFKKNPYPYVAQADVFVLSSRFEGFPNVVLDALACGTPVIATPAPGGVREILEGLEGCVLAESISAEALAKALKSFTTGYRVNTEVIATYSVGSIVQRYEQVLLDIKN